MTTDLRITGVLVCSYQSFYHIRSSWTTGTSWTGWAERSEGGHGDQRYESRPTPTHTVNEVAEVQQLVEVAVEGPTCFLIRGLENTQFSVDKINVLLSCCSINILSTEEKCNYIVILYATVQK